MRATLASPVHPAWAIAVCSVAAGLLLSAIAVEGTRLLDESRELAAVEAAAATRAARPMTARLTLTEDACDLDLTGVPHGAVMILGHDLEPLVVELDARGRGRVRGLRLPAGVGSLRLLPVDIGQTTVLALPSPTTTPSPASTPGPFPTPAAPPSTALTSSPTPAPLLVTVAELASRPEASPSATAPTHPPQEPTPALSSQPRRRDVAARGTPPVLHLIPDAGNRIALTFDGGLAANGSSELLDLLDELQLRVTLFVTGEFIEQHPALVRRAVLAGHEVGNHTYSHSHLTSYASNRRHRLLHNITREWLQEELRRTEDAFVRATGRNMAPLWRAPYGEENAALRGWAMELGYLHVRWSSLGGKSLDSLDWVNDEHSRMYRDSERIVKRLLGFPHLEGGIVLMHLSSDRERPPWRELPDLLDRLRERQLDVVTVSELLSASPVWRGWLEEARARHRATYAGGGATAAAAGSQP